MLILAIESFCNETAAVVVEDGARIHSNVASSRTALNNPYGGGVVPGLASRSRTEMILPVIAEALREADVILEVVDALAGTQWSGTPAHK